MPLFLVGFPPPPLSSENPAIQGSDFLQVCLPFHTSRCSLGIPSKKSSDMAKVHIFWDIFYTLSKGLETACQKILVPLKKNAKLKLDKSRFYHWLVHHIKWKNPMTWWYPVYVQNCVENSTPKHFCQTKRLPKPPLCQIRLATIQVVIYKHGTQPLSSTVQTWIYTKGTWWPWKKTYQHASRMIEPPGNPWLLELPTWKSLK